MFAALFAWRVVVHATERPTMQQAMAMEASTICAVVGCDGAQVAAMTMDIWQLVLTGRMEADVFAKVPFLHEHLPSFRKQCGTWL